MAKGVKVAVIGTVFAALVGGAGYGAYNVVSALNGDGSGIGDAKRSGPPDADEVAATTKKFFAAWEKGDAAGAADYTNNATVAQQLFTAYKASGHIGDVRITPGKATGRTVPYTVKATVSYKGKSKPLTYESKLTVVRGLTTGRALVDWQPSVVYPKLQRDDTLLTDTAASPPIEAVGRDGSVLTKEKYPSLGAILDALRARYGDKAGGSPGIELVIRHPDQQTQPDTSLLTLSEGTPGKLKTTISPTAQAAAEKAVKLYGQSSLVAVRPSTGEVLAVANNRKDAFNAAFEGTKPPGSTMKIMTSAMLIDNGVTSMTGPAPCTASAFWQGQTFKNLKGMDPNPGATLANSFLRSCNTAFINLVDKKPLTDDSLTVEAQDHFGIGKDWKTGVVSFDGKVPAVSGPDRAANMIGQGQVQMNPLNMASVTATAITGTFRQPYLVSPQLDDRQLATAEGLRSSTSAQLKQMMHLTATQGTAMNAMAGMRGDFGAKTGSAEVDGQAVSDSWFTGFRDDVAAAAMTEEGGHGADAAGPIVAAVLRAAG